MTYGQLRERATEIAVGLTSLGVERGQGVAILAPTCADWTLFELGAACAGAVLAPIYHSP